MTTLALTLADPAPAQAGVTLVLHPLNLPMTGKIKEKVWKKTSP
jgi:hypothetical protein